MTNHLERGWLLLEMGRFTESLSEFERAKSANEDSSAASAGMAFACLGLSRNRKAVAHAEASLALQPENWLAHCALGRAWRQRHQWKKAERHFKEALRLEPNRASLHSDLAGLLLAAGKPKDAERSAREGLKLVPDNLECREALVLSLLIQERLPEAAVTAQETLTFHPDASDAHRLVAMTAVQRDQFSVAQRHALEALRINPADSQARELYVESLKNSYPIYSAVVRFGMKVAKFFNKPAMIAPLALFPPCAIGCAVGLLAFALISSAISDIAFSIKAETRKLLTQAERNAAPWLTAALIYLVGTFFIGLQTNKDTPITSGLTAIFLLRPIDALFERLQLEIKGWYFYTTILVGITAVSLFLLSLLIDGPTLQPIAVFNLLLGVVLCFITTSIRFMTVERD